MFALKLPSQIKEGSSQTAYVAAQQRKAEMQAQALAPSPDENISAIAPSPDAAAMAALAMAAQRLQVQSSADEWSSVRQAVREHQREDDAASRASTTFSRVSFLPSDHSQQRVVERGISEYQIKQAKVSGCMSLAVRFDDDYSEQQARTKAREWGDRLKAALGLSLGDAKPKGPPGDRRIEVELVRSENRARDVKRCLLDNGYFSNRNRVLYILQPSAREEIVVVEGLIDYQIGEVGVITVIRRVNNEMELEMLAKPSEASAAAKRFLTEDTSAEVRGSWCSRTPVPWDPYSRPSRSVNKVMVACDEHGFPTIKGQLSVKNRKLKFGRSRR
jgi:hypothetical protein